VALPFMSFSKKHIYLGTPMKAWEGQLQLLCHYMIDFSDNAKQIHCKLQLGTDLD
jgi:hypothetical protein